MLTRTIYNYNLSCYDLRQELVVRMHICTGVASSHTIPIFVDAEVAPVPFQKCIGHFLEGLFIPSDKHFEVLSRPPETRIGNLVCAVAGDVRYGSPCITPGAQEGDISVRVEHPSCCMYGPEHDVRVLDWLAAHRR